MTGKLTYLMHIFAYFLHQFKKPFVMSFLNLKVIDIRQNIFTYLTLIYITKQHTVQRHTIISL